MPIAVFEKDHVSVIPMIMGGGRLYDDKAGMTY